MKNDDFLRKEIKMIKLDSPSSDFVGNVMNLVYFESLKVSKLNLIKNWMKEILPYTIVMMIFVIVSYLLYVNNISFDQFFINKLSTTFGTNFILFLRYIVGLIIGFGGILLLLSTNLKYSFKIKKQ